MAQCAGHIWDVFCARAAPAWMDTEELAKAGRYPGPVRKVCWLGLISTMVCATSLGRVGLGNAGRLLQGLQSKVPTGRCPALGEWKSPLHLPSPGLCGRVSALATRRGLQKGPHHAPYWEGGGRITGSSSEILLLPLAPPGQLYVVLKHMTS